MTATQTLSRERLKQLKNLLEIEGIKATSAIYQELSNLGYRYAGCAYGVTTASAKYVKRPLIFKGLFLCLYFCST
ncbi:hypothetical protein B9T25_00785 [Acinetobacter sp. ANC 4470]|nr:hypothetical protein B9T25_00785 [Acinetobacter sp. ANC 4470]